MHAQLQACWQLCCTPVPQVGYGRSYGCTRADPVMHFMPTLRVHTDESSLRLGPAAAAVVDSVDAAPTHLLKHASHAMLL